MHVVAEANYSSQLLLKIDINKIILIYSVFFFFFLKIISLLLYVLCVVDFAVIAAGVVGREGAGLTGAGVAVTVAGVVGTEEDTVTAGAVAVTGVAF